MQTVGLIGLGLMGGALAGRFLGGGLRVVGYDVRDDARRRLADLGGEAAASAREVCAAARVVVLSLPDSDAVAAVVGETRDLLAGGARHRHDHRRPGRDGRAGRRPGGRGGGVPRRDPDRFEPRGAGGRAGRDGRRRGGVFRQCEGLFRLFAKGWFHVGPWGSGARTKLVVNLVLGLNRAALAEGLAFARRCGLDPSAVLDVLRSGAAYSRAMDAKGRKMIDGDFAPEAKLAQHLKDVRLILDAGRRAGATLPLSELHERLLSELEGRGFGGCDNSAVIRAFDGEAGGP